MDDFEEFIKWLNNEGKKHINEVFKKGNAKIKIVSNINEILDDLLESANCDECTNEECPIKKELSHDNTTEIIENNEGCQIFMEVIGIDKRTLHFEATDDSIIINADKPTFCKEIPLTFRPSEKISASLKNGILTINVKKVQ